MQATVFPEPWLGIDISVFLDDYSKALDTKPSQDVSISLCVPGYEIHTINATQYTLTNEIHRYYK